MNEEIKDNTTWDSQVTSNFDHEDPEQSFREWLGLEGKCSTKDLSPGFYEWSSAGSVPGSTPGSEDDRMYPVKWTTYRAQDGTLLVVHCCFVDPQGIQRPILLATHPDHQRQGHGKAMLEYLTQRHVAEIGLLNPNESWDGIRITSPGAGWLNWAGKQITEYNKASSQD